jgi:hypothetical protein
VVYAYAADDFLRDGNGKQLVLNFNEALRELTVRNDGRAYGNGSEAALRQAIATGIYQDGDLALPPKELLHGYDVRGNITRRGQKVFAFLKAGTLPKIADTIANGFGDQLWAASGSEPPFNTSSVCHVRLTDGDHGWTYKGSYRSGVPLRLYRSPKQAPALTLRG